MLFGELIVENVNYDIIRKIVAGVIACTVLIILYIGYLMFQKIKLPKFIIHEAETPYELLKAFTNGAYFYGIIILSYITSIMICGVLFVIVINDQLNFVYLQLSILMNSNIKKME